LFAAACEVGLIANRPKAELTACRSVGMNPGIVPIVDDVLIMAARPQSSARTSATIFARQDHAASGAGVPPRQ
jgi:geranylgeranyl pyrophosphate synthase